MRSFLLPLSLPALFLLPANAAPAGQDGGEPATVQVSRRDFRTEIERDGSFVPSGGAEIQLWPENYTGGLMLLEVLPHGSYVNKGDVIARLDTETIDEQLHNAELELRSAQIRHENQVAQAELDEQAAREQRERSEAALDRARRDLEGWEQYELKFRERSQELQALYMQHNIQDQEDELAQLEAMYRDDELTDATEEIVLMRSRRNLARTRTNQKLDMDRRGYEVDYSLAQQKELKTEGLRSQDSSLERLVRSQELQSRVREDGVARSEDSLARQKSKLEQLRRDRELFEIHAPRGGMLLHGAPRDYRPGSTAPRHTRGASVTPRKTLFTIADPDRMAVALSVDEEQLGEVRSGMAATVRSVAAAGKEAVGRLKLDRFPSPSSAGRPQNSYRATVTLNDPLSGIVPGMRAKVELVTEELSSVLVLPQNAIFGSGDEACCYAETAGGGFERVSLRLGPASGGEQVAYGELSEGLRVLLNEPAE